MKKLIDVMNNKGFTEKQKYKILDLFDHISFENTETTANVFIELINNSLTNDVAIGECSTYLYNKYDGMKIRLKVLRLLKDKNYSTQAISQILSSFDDIAFEEKEEFGKLIIPIIENVFDVTTVLQRIEEEKENFKKINSGIENEKIIKVYHMECSECDYDNHDICVFIPNPCYYTSLGYHLVLQTEKHYIVIGIDKIDITEDISDYLNKYKLFDMVDCYDEDDCFEENISLLLVGEKLLSYKTAIKYHMLKFESFTLSVYPFKENENYGDRYDYPIDCFDRLITRKCECGGNGELMMCEMVNDFLIRCDKCHTSTYAEWPLRSAIDDWNNNETPIKIELDSENFLEDVKSGINYIALSDSKYIIVDNELKNCEYIIVSTNNGKYIIRGCFVRKIKESFYISKFHESNNEYSSEKIISTKELPIVFIEKTPFDFCFEYGTKKIFVQIDPMDNTLMISCR